MNQTNMPFCPTNEVTTDNCHNVYYVEFCSSLF